MGPLRFDALVIGGGPAGSIAAHVLATGGARVALVDKATFPRDKACGDLVGPRGLQVLADLGIPMPAGRDVGDMVVAGPTGRLVHLPCAGGLTYPGHGTAVTRTVFDAALHEAALEAGAEPIYGRAAEPLGVRDRSDRDGPFDGFRTSTGHELRADFIIGADGATSHVAAAAGLVDATRVLWGFAVRTYLPEVVDLPAIVLWEPAPWQAFPGYGWVFPGADGCANVGLGLGTLSDRQAGATAVRALPAFLEHCRALGLLTHTGPLSESGSPPSARLGGWLKMGMVGTTPAAGRVLLAGDAAGLVNPLQGEGISQAMASGRSAGEAVLHRPGGAAECYCAALAAQHLPYQRIAAATQAALLDRPRAVAAVTRMLTVLGRSNSFAGGWAVFWNELLDGAPPGRHRALAAAATRVARSLTARTATANWFDASMPGP